MIIRGAPNKVSFRWAIGLAIGAAVLFGLAWEARHMLNPEPRFTVRDGVAPVRWFNFRLAKSEFEPLRAQMIKFADAFGFENKSKYTSPDPYNYFFIFRRDDVDMASANRSNTGAPDLTFSINFYPKSGRPPPPAENVNVLIEGLKNYLAPVQGAVLTEVTRPR